MLRGLTMPIRIIQCPHLHVRTQHPSSLLSPPFLGGRGGLQRCNVVNSNPSAPGWPINSLSRAPSQPCATSTTALCDAIAAQLYGICAQTAPVICPWTNYCYCLHRAEHCVTPTAGMYQLFPRFPSGDHVRVNLETTIPVSPAPPLDLCIMSWARTNPFA